MLICKTYSTSLWKKNSRQIECDLNSVSWILGPQSAHARLPHLLIMTFQKLGNINIKTTSFQAARKTSETRPFEPLQVYTSVTGPS